VKIRAFTFLLLATSSSSSCAGAGGKGGAQSTSDDDDRRGDAARILCEAECRRDGRCHVGDPSTACFARCQSLPVRDPPVWSAAWATEVAGCIDASACDHDADEQCVFAVHHRSRSAEDCTAKGPAYARASDCVVLQGLAHGADDRVRACIASGASFDRCAPDYDWK